MGMVRYSDCVTISDCGDRWDSLKIHWGYSQIFTPFTGISHWARIWGTPPLPPKVSGWSEDPRHHNDEMKAQIRKINNDYKQVKHIIHQGDLYRLASPYKDEYVAFCYVLPDQSEALVHVTMLKPNYQRYLPRLRLCGLNPETVYEISGHPAMSGRGLMSLGLDVTFEGELDNYLIHLSKK